jgi:hypothetical protein
MTPTNQADLNVTSLTDKGGPRSSFELQLGTPGLTAQLQADPGAESSAGPGGRFTHRFADLGGGHLELGFHKALKGVTLMPVQVAERLAPGFSRPTVLRAGLVQGLAQGLTL